MEPRRRPWWMWALSGIGLYALGVKLLKLFINLGRREHPPATNELPEVGSERFLNALSTALNMPLRRGGTAAILNNGDAFFPALLEALRGAEHSIHLMTYIWKKGQISDRVFEVLFEKARRGVEVRIMVDGIGSFFQPEAQFRRLEELGGEVVVFSPILSPHLIHVNKRNHRRAMVIDGKLGFTGGMSISDDWAGDAQDPQHWRDTMVQVTGPMAHTVQAMFLQLWASVRGEQLVGPAYFPALEEEAAASGPLHLGVAHSPSEQVQPLLHFYWFSLEAARRRIYLASAYFDPNPFFRHLLMRKARQGLDVRILLPSKHTDNVLVRWNYQHMYENFLEAGIRIYEYTPTMMHAKQFVIDDVWTAVGSADLGVRSIKLNHEGMLGIASRELGREMREVFERDFARAREIELAAWRQRPVGFHARERFAAVLRAQY